MERKERDNLFHKEENEKRRKDHRSNRDDYQNRNFRRGHNPKIIETKLFVSKEELVEYANSKGQGSSTIEIFKIEDGLYKLVIKE